MHILSLLKRLLHRGDNTPAQLLAQLCSGRMRKASLIPARGTTVCDVSSIQHCAQLHCWHMPRKQRSQLLPTPNCSSSDPGLRITCWEKHYSETPACPAPTYGVTHYLCFALLIAWFPVLFHMNNFLPLLTTQCDLLSQHRKRKRRLLKWKESRKDKWKGKSHAGKGTSGI